MAQYHIAFGQYALPHLIPAPDFLPYNPHTDISLLATLSIRLFSYSGYRRQIVLSFPSPYRYPLSTSDKEWTDYVGGKASAEDRKILLQIPDALLENLTLSTTNENISLSALAVNGNIVVDSNGGDIVFERLKVGKSLSLTAKNGNIGGTIIGSYDDFAIQTEIKKGDSNLPDNKTDGRKTLHVSSNNGDVNIEFVKE